MNPEIVSTLYVKARLIWRSGGTVYFLERGAAACLRRVSSLKNRVKSFVLGPVYLCAVALGLNWARAYLRVGDRQAQRKQYRAAIENYDMAIALKHDWPEPHVRRAEALFALGQTTKAVEDLEMPRPSRVDDPGLAFRLATLLASQGKHAEAIEHYERAVALAPTWADGHLYLGDELVLAGCIDDGLVHLRKAIKLNPVFAFPYNWMSAYHPDSIMGDPNPEQLSNESLLIDAYNRVAAVRLLQGKCYDNLEVLSKLRSLQLEVEQDLELDESLRAELKAKHQVEDNNFCILPDYWVRLVGHIAAIGYYIKMAVLKSQPTKRILVLAPPGKVANQCFLDYFRNYVEVVSDPSLIEKLWPLQRYFGDALISCTTWEGREVLWFEAAMRAQRQWDAEQRAPLLSLAVPNAEKGRQRLEELGVPRDGWFVAMHVRESGFHKDEDTPTACRNARIEDFTDATRAIVDRGGWVIRLGDPTMQPAPKIEGLIDYAHTDAKSDWMDVFLCAQCRFFFGSDSGLGLIPVSFGGPCAFTNVIPSGLVPLPANSLLIPKLYRSSSTKLYVGMEELVPREMHWASWAVNLLASRGLEFSDNTPEEIKDLAVEMLDRLDGTSHSTDEDESLQEQWTSLAAGLYGGARVGQKFLRRYYRPTCERD